MSGKTYRASVTKTGDLSIVDVDAKDAPKQFIKPKTNDFGQYFIGQFGETRYFISERTNSKGGYMLLKPAPERVLDSGAKDERPASYGTRKS